MYTIKRLGRLAPITLMLILACALALTGACLTAPRANAAGDTVTLEITNPQTQYPYGSNVAVRVTVQLGGVPLGPGENPQAGYGLFVNVSNASSYQVNWVSNSADGLTFTFAGDIGHVDPGNYTATTSYENPDTHVTTTSQPVSFTVVTGPSSVTCQPLSNTVLVGASLPINTYLNGIPSPRGETFTVSLSGPVTSPPVTMQTDSLSSVYITAPTTIGSYSLICSFAGDTRYNGSSVTIPNALTVNGNAHIAGMKLYTNPTTTQRGVVLTFYITLQPAPGLPTPTGYLTIHFGPANQQYFTYQSVAVGAHGDTLVQLDALPVYGSLAISPIIISYGGDSHYTHSSFTFSLTNPPIPGSAPSSGTTLGSKDGKSGGSATPTTTAETPTTTAETPTTTLEPSPTATVIAPPTTGSTTPTEPNVAIPVPLLWVTGGLGAVIALGAAAGLVFYLRRRPGLPLDNQDLVATSAPDASSPPPVEGRPDE